MNDRQRSDVVYPRSRRPSDDLRRFNPRGRLLTVAQFSFSISTACRRSHNDLFSGRRWVANLPTVRVNFPIPHTPDHRPQMPEIHIKARWTIAGVPHQALFYLIFSPLSSVNFTLVLISTFLLSCLCHHPPQPNQPVLSCLSSQLSRNSSLLRGQSHTSPPT